MALLSTARVNRLPTVPRSVSVCDVMDLTVIFKFQMFVFLKETLIIHFVIIEHYILSIQVFHASKI